MPVLAGTLLLRDTLQAERAAGGMLTRLPGPSRAYMRVAGCWGSLGAGLAQHRGELQSVFKESPRVKPHDLAWDFVSQLIL